MKRDLNLVRDILLAMEAEPKDWQQLGHAPAANLLGRQPVKTHQHFAW
jgi:hypothetical protein